MNLPVGTPMTKPDLVPLEWKSYVVLRANIAFVVTLIGIPATMYL